MRKTLTSVMSLLMLSASVGMLLATAQTVKAQGASGNLLEEVVVTARKKSTPEALQEVPVAVSAFTGDQLDAQFVHNIQALGFSMPNVSLEDIATLNGTANFSIRGLGVNSSIPSIDPTVGVFVDGMYLGINAGVVFDFFDLEGIEVLRGPQGLLFGRNVTGGAVLLKTRRPSDEFTFNAKAGLEAGLQKTLAASISGPLGKSEVRGRLTAYYKDDDGWYENDFNGNDDFGKDETFLIRPSISISPNDMIDLTVRYEHGEISGDGPAGQNRGLFDRHSYNFAIDEEGFTDVEWDQIVAELNVDVPFGNGTITDILGWRDFESDSLADIDSTPSSLFHAPAKIRQDQISNEIRYSGRFFDRADLTAGFYYFTQDITYFENRLLFGDLSVPVPAAIPLPGSSLIDSTLGGQQDQETLGVFAQTDIDVTTDITLNLGIRYTYEEKDVDIATFVNSVFLAPGIPLPPPFFAPSACDLDAETCNFDFSDRDSWKNWTPKVGLQWRPTPDMQLYAFWTKGFRSGGYNFRNTSPDPASVPGPFDEEKQDSFEIGGKADWLDGRVRTNLALFYNDVDDLQREINLPGAVAGVVQIIRNTADAEIKGIEFELQALLMENLYLSGNVGYVDGDYKNVRFDLNGDGVLNDADEDLDIPRLAPVTYNITLVHDLPLPQWGTFTSRFSFGHRDEAAYTDNNLGTLNEVDMLDISGTLTTWNDHLKLSAYGKNLLNEVTAGNDTQLPFFPGATFSPLNNKGARWGVEVSYRY